MFNVTKNQLITAGLLAFIVLAFYWGLRTQPVPVDLATIKRGDLFVTVNEEGVTRIREIYTVSAPISGVLRRLSLKAGDHIQKDKTIVAIIEPLAPTFQDARSMNVLRANVKSAQASLVLTKAELSRVEADYDYLNADFNRIARLYKKRIIARKLYDKTAASKRMAQARCKSGQSRRCCTQKRAGRDQGHARSAGQQAQKQTRGKKLLSFHYRASRGPGPQSEAQKRTGGDRRNTLAGNRQ